jgi:hypothetical protein
MPGEHKVHPYMHPESLCRGESCIRPYPAFQWFLLFSDRLLCVMFKKVLIANHFKGNYLIPDTFQGL